MALGTRNTGTFNDLLLKLLQDLAVAKTMPDADLNFVVQLETQIIQEIRAPQDHLAAIQAAQQGQGGLPGAGGLPPGGDPTAGLPPQLAALLQGGGAGPGGPGGPGGPPGLGAGAPPPGAGGPGGGAPFGPAPVPGLRASGGNDALARLLSQ